MSETKTGRHCTVCSGDRAAIEVALLDGESLSAISDRFGMARSSLRRHRNNHMHLDAEQATSMGLDPVAVVARIAQVAERARELAEDALDAGRHSDVLRAGDAELRALATLLSLGVKHEDFAWRLEASSVVTRAVIRAAREDASVGEAIAAQLDVIDRRAYAQDIRQQFQESKEIGT